MTDIHAWLTHSGLKTIVNGHAKDIRIDSRAIQMGDVFLALKGFSVDGADYVTAAENRGASLILSHRPVVANIPVIVLDGSMAQVGHLIDRFYKSPSEKLNVVGITGTNGKTSVSHYIAQLAHLLDVKSGVIGTNGMGAWGQLDTSANTTPDVASVHHQLSNLVSKKVTLCAMEVSSHGLDQGRTAGVRMHTGIFTNLTRDHLDYHGTMENYAAAKAKLFEARGLKHGVINADDLYGAQLVEQFSKREQHLPILTYGVRSSHADIRMQNVSVDHNGTHGRVITPWGEADLSVSLLGEFNLSNLLAAITALLLQGFDLETVISGAEKVQSVCGRMELIGNFVVDYAHTPDAIKKALKACRAHCSGKLWIVFGCGGDRDAGKRALMAKAAEKYADYVIVTDDNPRTENAGDITDEILSGFKHQVEVIHERDKAIAHAFKRANNNDLILVAGKGHEDYQEINGIRHAYSDQESIRSLLTSIV